MGEPFVIDIGVGVGPIRYGMSRKAVEAELGVPQKICAADDVGTETWEYRFRRLEVDYDQNLGDRVIGITVLGDAVLPDGENLIGASEGQLKAWMLKHGQVTAAETVGHLLEYGLEGLGLTFYIEEGRVRSICCGPLWDEHSDEPRWPQSTS